MPASAGEDANGHCMPMADATARGRQVTISGQSAGGAAVAFHLTMKSARGLFRGAILMSPGGRKGWVQDLKEDDNDGMSAEEMAYNANALATSRGCGSTAGASRLDCMRNLSLGKLLAEPYGRFAPGVDGLSVTSQPLQAVKAGAWHAEVEVVLGSTSCESCAGEGMLVKPGAPHDVSEDE